MHDLIRQKTLYTGASLQGTALHSGQKVKVTLRPAPANTGIIFNRTDIDRGAVVEARAENIVDTARATTLAVGDVRVATVEHLLSALHGLGVDNAYVDVDSSELPAMDGSAAPFVELIRRAGLRPLQPAKRIAVLRKTVEVRDGDRFARLSPAPCFSIDCSIAFDSPIIQAQRLQVDFTATNYERQLAAARTFAFFKEVQWLYSQGLAAGGSLDNCVVLDGEKILNPDGLRFDDEFVRHKVVDAVGDLALMGMPFIGKLTCHKSGHALHRDLVRALIADPDAYEVLIPKAPRTLARRGLSLPDWAPAHLPLAA